MLITCPKCSARYQIPSKIKVTEGKKMQCSACGHIFKYQAPHEELIAQNPQLIPPTDAVLSFDSQVKRIVVKEKKSPVSSSTTSVLPEAFRPLQNKTISTKNSSPFWVLVSALLFVGLMTMAWLWRDLLKMNNQFSPLKHTSIPVRVHKTPVSAAIVSPEIPVFVTEEKQPEVVPQDVLSPKTEAEGPSVTPVVSEVVSAPHLSVQSVRFRKDSTGNMILIEGVLKNNTTETLIIPEKIYASAYDTKGGLVFEKEIYLPKGTILPEMEQPFFSTYAPAKEEIQWIDVTLEK